MAGNQAAALKPVTVTSPIFVTGAARFSFAMTIGLTKRVQNATAPLVGSSEQPNHAWSMLDVTPATIVSSATTCQLFVVPVAAPKYPIAPCAKHVRP
jgi:hypothetical protein